MSKYKKLSQIIYKCDYHIVWVPKYRFQILKGSIKTLVERDIRLLCEWKSSEVQELNVQEDHIHLLANIDLINRTWLNIYCIGFCIKKE